MASAKAELELRVATFTELDVRPLYCTNPVKFLSVHSTAVGALEVVENDTAYVPAADLVQLTDALPFEVLTFPVAPSIVCLLYTSDAADE